MNKKFGFILPSTIYYGIGVNMNELFLFSFGQLKTFFNSELTFLVCFIIVFILTVLCSAIALTKKNYSVKNRLWVIFCFIGVLTIDFWIEQIVIGQIKYLILLLGVQFISLSICFFINKSQPKISDEKKSLANFLSKCALKENHILDRQIQGEIRSEVIKAKPSAENSFNDEIDFSHVKTVLKKLEYYPLKEQDKKSAKELENAIKEAEENGLDQRLKQNINDGLGILLKLMSKYAI